MTGVPFSWVVSPSRDWCPTRGWCPLLRGVSPIRGWGPLLLGGVSFSWVCPLTLSGVAPLSLPLTLCGPPLSRVSPKREVCPQEVDMGQYVCNVSAWLPDRQGGVAKLAEHLSAPLSVSWTPKRKDPPGGTHTHTKKSTHTHTSTAHQE